MTGITLNVNSKLHHIEAEMGKLNHNSGWWVKLCGGVPAFLSLNMSGWQQLEGEPIPPDMLKAVTDALEDCLLTG